MSDSALTPRKAADRSVRDGAARLGPIVRGLRQRARMTLQQASAATGLAPSTLSKIERGQISPTYDNLLNLAAGLGVSVNALFATGPTSEGGGRRAVTRRGAGVRYATRHYDYEMLCTELTNKSFTALRATLKCRTVEEFQSLIRHRGEEYVFVLSGTVDLHTEHYEVLRLEAGDSCYFNSGMGHALCSVGPQDATVLWIASDVDIGETQAGD